MRLVVVTRPGRSSLAQGFVLYSSNLGSLLQENRHCHLKSSSECAC